MRTTAPFALLALLLASPTAHAKNPVTLVGTWVGQGQNVQATAVFNPRSRTLAIKERRGFGSTTSSRRTTTLQAPAGSPVRNLFHQTYYVRARPVEKVQLGIYFFRDGRGQPTSSSRRPEGTRYHRIHLPAQIQASQQSIQHIVERALGVEQGRYNSVQTWK